LTFTLFGAVIKTPILSVDKKNQLVTIAINKIDIGISGFLVHRVSKTNSTILKNLEVVSFDSSSQVATLKMTTFNLLRQNALPKGKWQVQAGDIAILAFGYSRALLVAPSEEIYYRITKATSQVEWVHPDIFAAILSFNGHPTPLKEDFKRLSLATSSGLVFFYLDKKLYTVDSSSLKVINISDAPLKQDSVKLPFFTRVDEIEADWWGEGSDELESYEPYYFSLLLENNPTHTQLHELYKKFNTKK